MAYYLVFGPVESVLEEMVYVAGQVAALDRCVEAARAEVGLADYEVRHWHGWYRHITLAMVAHAYLTFTRLHAAKA
jgi:SRSO17 transposase